MSKARRVASLVWARLGIFSRDRRGASAVEFAIVSIPFIMVLLCILQMGIYYMTQASLDAGVIAAADTLVNSYNSGTTPTVYTPATLNTLVAAKAGGMINTTTLKSDLRILSNLTTAVVAIPAGGYVDSPIVLKSILVLRAEAKVVAFMPGFSSLIAVRSAALVRRQGL